MRLAAVERPSVVEPERDSAHPHRGSKQLVIARNLRDHHNRSHWNSHGAREESRHADKRERRRMHAPRRRQNAREEYACGSAESRAAHKCRCKYSARAAGADGERSRDDVEEEDREKHECVAVLDEATANDRIASAVYAWKYEVAEKTDDETADDNLRKTGDAEIRERLLGAAEEADVESRAERYDERERKIRKKPQRVLVCAGRHREERLPSEEVRVDRVRDRRGDEARKDSLVLDVAR